MLDKQHGIEVIQIGRDSIEVSIFKFSTNHSSNHLRYSKYEHRQSMV